PLLASAAIRCHEYKLLSRAARIVRRPGMSHAAVDHNYDNDDERPDGVPLVPLEGVVDLDDVLAGEVSERAPGSHPQHRAQRVVAQEFQPVHAKDACEEPVDLAQAIDEAGDRDDLAAI